MKHTDLAAGYKETNVLPHGEALKALVPLQMRTHQLRPIFCVPYSQSPEVWAQGNEAYGSAPGVQGDQRPSAREDSA